MSTLIALLQLNPTVGALEANTERLLAGVKRAQNMGAQLVLTSELVVPGYPPRDLLDRPSFVRSVLDANQHLINRSESIPLVFGSLGHHDGKLTNDAFIAQNGKLLGRASKQLLPTYDVFDEHRYFTAGESLHIETLAGLRCAISICEDAWGNAPELKGRYSHDPLARVSPNTADLLVNLSASPFTLTKLRGRERLFAGQAKHHNVPLAMVNQVGANDELIFDGRSALFGPSGELIARAKMFEEDLLLTSLIGPARVEPDVECEPEAAYRALVVGVRDYARKCGFKRAVLGLSGGIDSALVATVAADALGPENVQGIAMPTRYSSSESVEDARHLAENLGIGFELLDIDPIFASYIRSLSAPLDAAAEAGEKDVTWENVQARIRGATVMAFSNRSGALPLTTGNKSEVAVGYCTLYGDMVGGLSVISDVPKTMVYKIANWVNQTSERIPERSITKPPSAELRPGQLDQDSLPPYEVLDAVLAAYIEDHKSVRELLAQGFDPAVVERVVGLVTRAEYKRRQAAPGLIITRKAFGPGRRIPLAQQFRER